MGKQCNGSIQVCTLRASVLDDDGSPLAGAGNLWVTDALIKIDWKAVVKAGSNFELENGCGGVCVTFQGRDIVKSVDLSMELCSLDAEGIVMLTGGNPVTVDGDVVGWTLPDPAVVNDRYVSIEAWSLAWANDEQATEGSDLLYHHWVWPRVSWSFGDGGLANEAFRVPLVGHGTSNGNFGDGPGNDLPWGVFTTPMGSFVDDLTPPTALCGTSTLLAS